MPRAPLVQPQKVSRNGTPLCPDCLEEMSLRHGTNFETELELIWWVCSCGATTAAVPIPHFVARALRTANRVRYSRRDARPKQSR